MLGTRHHLVYDVHLCLTLWQPHFKQKGSDKFSRRLDSRNVCPGSLADILWYGKGCDEVVVLLS
jgi:hypothetical protein